MRIGSAEMTNEDAYMYYHCYDLGRFGTRLPGIDGACSTLDVFCGELSYYRRVCSVGYASNFLREDMLSLCWDGRCWKSLLIM